MSEFGRTRQDVRSRKFLLIRSTHDRINYVVLSRDLCPNSDALTLPRMAHAMTQHSDGGAIPQITLARRLLLARLERGLSQRDMAKLIGKTERTIGRYEVGDATAPLAVVLAYAMVTGIDRDWLLSGTDRGQTATPDVKNRCAA